MRGKPIPDPRRIGEHVATVIDMLHEGGAEDVRVYKTKHLVVCFKLGAHRFEMRMACTPRNEHDAISAARQELTRIFHRKIASVYA